MGQHQKSGSVVPLHPVVSVTSTATGSNSMHNEEQSTGLRAMAEDLLEDHSTPFKKGESIRVRQAFEAQFSEEELKHMSEWERTREHYREKTAAILNTQKFDLAINFVILLNSLTIGWESQLQVQEKSTAAIAWTEHLFLVIYTIELSARFFAFGVAKSLRSSGWIVFDFTLVSVGIISQWLLPLIFAGQRPEVLEPLFVFRVLRLLRLARAVRLIVTFKTLWLLVRGLMSSADTIMFTFVLMAMTVYVFAVVGLELISKNRSVFVHADDGTFAPEGYLTGLMDNEFADVGSIMLALLGFTTLDSVNRIYAPLIKAEPLLFFYFIPFILVVSVAMMNLVTAVLVENALESSRNDKEMNAVYARRKLEQMMPEIKRMFRTLDLDGSGAISKEEMVGGLQAHPTMRIELEHYLGALGPLQLFDILDVDGDSQVSISEFCDHLIDRVTSEAPIEMTKVLKIVQQNKQVTHKILANQQKMAAATGFAVGRDGRVTAGAASPSQGSSVGGLIDVSGEGGVGIPEQRRMLEGGGVEGRSYGDEDLAALTAQVGVLTGQMNHMTEVLNRVASAVLSDEGA